MSNIRVRVRRGATTYNLDTDMEFDVREEFETRVALSNSAWHIIVSETGWIQKVRRSDCLRAPAKGKAAGEGAV